MAEYERRVGTVVRGIRMPIIREGDDLAEIVTTGLLEAAEFEGFSLRDRDVVAMTESIVARAQGNYCTVDDIADDVREKLGGETIGVILPILSRNRFAICLRGIARGCKKIVLMLSYPADEVGNSLLPLDKLEAEASVVLPDKEAEILVYCRSGRRSADAGEVLTALGYKRVADFGGILLWPYEVVTDP